MFHSTQHLEFRPIASLGRFKIHQPLPLNPRESQQLLNLLTTSFRQQLDREHGTFRHEITANTKRRRTLRTRPDGGIPTDRHLHSILTNPLFSYGSERRDLKHQRDPMEIFEEACAKGFMKLEYASACLKAKKNMIVLSPAISVRDAMKASEAGSKVLRWLVSSGVVNDLNFLQDKVFSRVLMDFIVAEELQAAVWSWMDKLLLTPPTTHTPQAIHQNTETGAYLLDVLIRAEASGYGSLDSAFASFKKAKDRLDRLHCPTRAILWRAGLFLSRESTSVSPSRLAPSWAIYDSFLDMVSAFTVRKDLHLSHLQLHHPTKPDASSALNFLMKVKADLDVSPGESSPSSVDRKEYPSSRIISIGLDAAKLLLEQDQQANARWVMNFLQENYAKQLGLTRRKIFEQAQAEASSLELLKSLNIA